MHFVLNMQTLVLWLCADLIFQQKMMFMNEAIVFKCDRVIEGVLCQKTFSKFFNRRFVSSAVL